MTDQEPANKEQFLDHLDHTWAELEETLDSYNLEQMTQRTDQVGWTVKDHLAHLVSWEEGIIALLRKQPRWEAMGVNTALAETRLNPLTEDELNQVMRDQTQGLSLANVRERLSAANAELRSVVESMDAGHLLKGYSHFAPDEPGEETGRPVLGWVVGNSSGHYDEHLPWIRDIAGTAK
jgi:hypothetical protein